MKEIRLLNFPINLSLLFFIFSLLGYALLVFHFPLLWYKQDLHPYYLAGKAVLMGKNIYAFGHEYTDFIYPPFASILFAFFAFFPITLFKWFMTIISIVSLLLTCGMTLYYIGYIKKEQLISQTLLFSSFLLWLEPIQQTLEYGQINLILMAMIMLGFYYRKKPYLSGSFIGLAAGIKLTPLIFILYLLLIGKKRAFLISLFAFLVTILLGFIVLPKSSVAYWGGLLIQTGRVGNIALIGNQSLYAMLTRLFGSSTIIKPFWYTSELLVGSFGLWIANRAYKRKYALLSLLLCAVTGLLLSPVSWSHHWIWIAPLLTYFFTLVYYYKSSIGWFMFIITFILFCWATPLIPDLSSMHHIVPISIPTLTQAPFLQENAYVLFGMFFILVSSYFISVNTFIKENILKIVKK